MYKQVVNREIPLTLPYWDPTDLGRFHLSGRTWMGRLERIMFSLEPESKEGDL
jgi:hypothetical protein